MSRANLESPGLTGAFVFDPTPYTDDFEEQYAIRMKALADHTVATIKTNISGKGASPSIPAGTYYVVGTINEFLTTGARGCVSGGTVTLNNTGYQKLRSGI